jgi:anti-sigma factor RsiW
MIAASECDKVLLVQAELDGELDAAAAAALAAHHATCPVCQAAAAELAQARALIGAQPLYQAMPDDVRARIIAQIAAAQPRHATIDSPRTAHRGLGMWRGWWTGAAGFGLGAACAAGLSFLILVPQQPGLVGQVVASHIRALQPGHLEDVPSTDQHTVKPWFDGRIDFAPPVKDLATQSFPLRGGRLDYVDGRPVAALVYQHAKHFIDLFVWPAPAGAAQPPQTATRQGYNVVHWRQDGMTLWAVSDMEADLLRKFAEDWRRIGD